jgi:MOSC domain-containing protein YiiM
MKIHAINASKPVKINFNHEEVVTGIFKSPLEGEVQITKLGVAGDTIADKTVHGGLDQAIYIYHQEDYDWWAKQLGKSLDPGTFGENLTLSGLDDIAWVIGDRLKIGDLILEITAPRTPCFKLAVRMGDNRFLKQFVQAARPGAYARVIAEGAVKVGDEVEIEKTPMDYASVKDVFVEWHRKDMSVSLVQKALNSPIASMHREKLQDWYDSHAL